MGASARRCYRMCQRCRSWSSPVTAQQTSMWTSWIWTWMRISEMAWVACALHHITLLLTLQGGELQQAPHSADASGGESDIEPEVLPPATHVPLPPPPVLPYFSPLPRPLPTIPPPTLLPPPKPVPPPTSSTKPQVLQPAPLPRVAHESASAVPAEFTGPPPLERPEPLRVRFASDTPASVVPPAAGPGGETVEEAGE